MGLLGGIGSIVGGIFGGNDEDEQQKKAFDQYQNDIGDYEQLKNQGALKGAYKDYQTQTLNPSQFTQGQADQTGRNAQAEALARTMNMASQGGMDAQSRAAYNETINNSNANEASQRAAMMQNAQMRGVGGSGLEMANHLAAQQGSANRMNQAGLGAASDARARAIQALSQGGQMGAQLNNQDYGQFANKAQAQDQINRFNWENSQNNANRNADRGQAYQQQQFNNRMSAQQGQSNARGNLANAYIGKGKEDYTHDTAMGAGVGSTLDDVVGGLF